MTFEALYREVLARPFDNAARHVLADFLSDEGDPLGALIRAQCDLAEKGPAAPRAQRVAEAALLAEHGSAWHARFAPWATEVSFARGFPALAWTTVSWLAKEGKNGTPLPNVSLVIELEQDDDGAQLLDCPVLESATAIELSRGLVAYSSLLPTLDSFWPALARAKDLKALHLEHLHRPEDGQGLLGLPQLGALEELSLRATALPLRYRTELFERLARSSALVALDLTGGIVSPLLPQLRTLLQRGTVRRLVLDHGGLSTQELGDLAGAAARNKRSVLSIGRLTGPSGAWGRDERLAAVVRQDPEDLGARPVRAPPDRPPLGQFGVWQLDDLIGIGAGTARYLVRCGGQRGLLTHLCASASRFGPAPDELALQREALERAARDLVGLAHPNLVRWLDAGVHGTAPFVVHELVPCGPARDVLFGLRGSAGRLPLPLIARVGLDVCRALMALHQAGLTHGAVNETTVFVELEGGASARLLPLGVDSPVFYGSRSHRFLAPEQVLGHPRGPQADLFQLGALLHLLLSGAHPFGRPTDLATQNAIIRRGGDGPPDLGAQVPRPLAELVFSLLEVAPEHRPGSAEEVLLELALRTHQPMTGAPAPLADDAANWTGRAFELARLLTRWGPVTDRRD